MVAVATLPASSRRRYVSSESSSGSLPLAMTRNAKNPITAAAGFDPRPVVVRQIGFKDGPKMIWKDAVSAAVEKAFAARGFAATSTRKLCVEQTELRTIQ